VYDAGHCSSGRPSSSRDRVDEYARRTTEESGKPLAQARGEWAGAPNYLRFAAGEARRLGGRWIPARVPGRRIDVTYEPLGVVGVITAWNFPIYNVNRAVASALAAGCTAVVRPSEFTPRSAFDYAQRPARRRPARGRAQRRQRRPCGMGRRSSTTRAAASSRSPARRAWASC
jgi:hypothetical protein